MINFKPDNLKVNSVSPGVKALNNAGIAIKRENKGINTHVLFKKNPRLILEKITKIRHTEYNNSRNRMFFIKSMATRNSIKDTTLIRGSIDCRNPFFKA